jgi:hypothetical protein
VSSLSVSVLLDVPAELGYPRLLRYSLQHLEGEKHGSEVALKTGARSSPVKEPERNETMTAATKNLEKWLFYFDRFNNHELSAKLDQALCEATEEKMVEVQEASDLSWIEVGINARRLSDPNNEEFRSRSLCNMPSMR